ncbi:MAG: Hsp33 family molecular chaperone HslO [Christensenellales bacterium]
MMKDTDSLIFDAPDSVLRLILAEGQARVVMCRTTRLTQEAVAIHQASDVAATAMGRLLSAGALMGSLMDGEEDSLTLSVAGDGPAGRLMVVARQGSLKIALDQPQLELPALEDGRQDVAGYIGKRGKLTVVRDSGAGEPHIGISNLVSGELGMDLAEYFAMSEQTPSLVALGCLVQEGVVLSAGGILIQALPGCSDRVLDQLELREPFFSGISREIYDRSLMTLAGAWFEGLDLQVMEEQPLALRCDCSREKMEKALIALGRADLEEIAASGEETRMTCHFCRACHSFSAQRVREILSEKGQEGAQDAVH